jgi:hypothetical protein
MLLRSASCSPEPASQATADDSAEQPASTAAAEPAKTNSPSASPAAPPSGGGRETGIPEFGIPPAIQGRWGLVLADCTSTRGDAKGLLIVSPTTLTFYESRGTLKRIVGKSDTRIRAMFAFTGEGMQWSREMALDLEDGGKALVRREFGEDAASAPLRYARCP